MLPQTKTFQETYKGAICVCAHCGNKFGATGGTSCALYCAYCKTQENRDAMDVENAALGIVCEYCPALKAQKQTPKT